MRILHKVVFSQRTLRWHVIGPKALPMRQTIGFDTPEEAESLRRTLDVRYRFRS